MIVAHLCLLQQGYSGVAVTFTMARVPTLTGNEKFAPVCVAASFAEQHPLCNTTAKFPSLMQTKCRPGASAPAIVSI